MGTYWTIRPERRFHQHCGRNGWCGDGIAFVLLLLAVRLQELRSWVDYLEFACRKEYEHVTANAAVSIAGPITFYGGDLTFRENMSSSLSGADVLVKGTGKVETIANRSFLTNNGDVTFWSDSDNSSGGPVVLGDDNGSTRQTVEPETMIRAGKDHDRRRQ